MEARTRTAFTVAAVPVAVVGLSTGAAAVEGNFSSYMSEAQTGFNSHTWHDNNTTDNGTVVSFKGCSPSWPGLDKSAGVKLVHDISWAPDENFGPYQFNCGDHGGHDYGRRSAGDYRFTLTHIGGRTSGAGLYLDVHTVGVSW